LYRANGIEANFWGEQIIHNDMMDAEFMGTLPVLIGGNRVTNYAELRKYFTANTTIGIDLQRREQEMQRMGSQLMMYRDTNVANKSYDGTDNLNRALAIMPGSLKLVNMAKNDLNFPSTDKVRREVFIDPFYGLKHDVKVIIEDCGDNGPEITMQFSTIWDVIGVASCWTEDENFEGVTGVFCYNIECADTGACEIDSPIQDPQNLSDKVKKCGDESTPCDAQCKALFTSQCQEYALFQRAALAAGTISAVSINGIEYQFGEVFNIANQAGADGLVAKLQDTLKNLSSVNQVSGGWEAVGGDAEFYFVTSIAITSIILRNDAGADVDMTRTVQYLVNVVDQSTVSTNANYETLALSWTAPDTTTFSGTPTESIFSSVTTGHYGVMGNFYAEVAEGGDYALDITDSEGCESQYTSETDACVGLNFDVVLFAFDDEDDDDTQDPAELGLAGVKLRVYAGVSQTTLVDEIVTDVDGLALFSLEAGFYNVQIVENDGATVGRTITTTNPKYFEVTVAGGIVYGASWTEDSFLPIGPAV
jgi:hypothetical protein